MNTEHSLPSENVVCLLKGVVAGGVLLKGVVVGDVVVCRNVVLGVATVVDCPVSARQVIILLHII